MGICYHLLTPLLFTHPTGATGHQALVIYMNKIRMSVCLSVRLFDRYLPLGNLTRMDILYMVRSGIYPEVSLYIFQISRAKCPVAIVRKPDTIGKYRTKIAHF